MLHEEVALYKKLTGDNSNNIPIIQIGAYLDGYEKGLSVLKDIKAEIEASREVNLKNWKADKAYGLKIALDIIDRYISGKGSKDGT